MSQTVLIINEEAGSRKALAHAIRQKLCYQTLEAETIDRVEMFFSVSTIKKPDLILLDISNIAGFEQVIQALKSFNDAIPVVVVIQYGDYENAMKAITAGAQDFLSKPIAIERLKITLHNVLHLRDARYRNSLHSYTPPVAETKMCLSMLNEEGNIRKIDEMEKQAIEMAIRFYNGHMTEVARRLGIGRSTLYRKIDDFGLKLAMQAAITH